MTPSRIDPRHYPVILRNNAEFVHWLSPLDDAELIQLLKRSDYARQILQGEAALFAYDGASDNRHKHLDWLSDHLDHYLYIDRIIVANSAQGQGAGRTLYHDLESFARKAGHTHLACEINTALDNPGSHAFHLKSGFSQLGEADYPDGLSVRYYVRKLLR